MRPFRRASVGISWHQKSQSLRFFGFFTENHDLQTRWRAVNPTVQIVLDFEFTAQLLRTEKKVFTLSLFPLLWGASSLWLSFGYFSAYNSRCPPISLIQKAFLRHNSLFSSNGHQAFSESSLCKKIKKIFAFFFKHSTNPLMSTANPTTLNHKKYMGHITVAFTQHNQRNAVLHVQHT